LKNISGKIKGKLVSVGKEVRNLNGVQVLYISILVDSSRAELIPGLIIQGEMILPKVTIKEYVFSLFKTE